MEIPKLILQVTVTGSGNIQFHKPYIPIMGEDVAKEYHKCFEGHKGGGRDQAGRGSDQSNSNLA